MVKQYRLLHLLVDEQDQVNTANMQRLSSVLFANRLQHRKAASSFQLLINAIQSNDLPLVQTLTFIFAALIVTFNLIADVLYGILDPRIRYD